MVAFGALKFGFASAEIESAESPELLVNAFLDRGNIVPELLSGRRAIVLGVKGSGKSAVGLHLSLLTAGRHDYFLKTFSLGDLSFTHLGRLSKPELEPDIRYPQAWEWVLLLAILASITRDQAVVSTDSTALDDTVRVLTREGLLPGESLTDAVQQARLETAELSLWGLKIAKKQDQPSASMSPATVTHYVREVVRSVSTPNRHMIIIDGLDDVQIQGSDRLHALSGLLLQSSRLNNWFREHGLPFKIVVLCRSDLFERLPGANLNKLKQDMAIELDWYVEADDPRQSPLVRLANLRAYHTDPTVSDVFRQHLPRKIDSKSPEKYLLEYSRHTPRDFLQTLTYIQQAGGNPREYRTIRAGMRSYSEKYFLGEIADELDGSFERTQIDRLVELLRRFRLAEFHERELRQFMESPDNLELTVELRPMLAALYRCGGIGNVFIPSDTGRRYSFRFRNPTSSFNPGERVVVHKGLRKVLGLSSGNPGT